MAAAVYVLCALTSAACAALLLRGYRQSGVRLLLWSALCFIGLFLNNALLFYDMVVIPELDLSFWRKLPAIAGLVVLIYGLVTES